MEEEIIKITIDEVMNQIKSTNVDSLEGLCFWCSNNVKSYLEEQGIKCEIYNIRDLKKIDLDHYFLIADNFLIDLTYSQFKEKNEELLYLEKWPSAVLKSTKEGEIILNELLTNHYVKLKENYLNKYLDSFQSKEKKVNL